MRIPWVNREINFGVAKLPPRRDRIATLEAEVVTLKEEAARLEGLLDLGPDPDANLTGTQRHSLFRTTGTLGQGTRDFHGTKRGQVLKMSHELYALRGNAFNIIELTVDHIVGERLEPAPVTKDTDGEVTVTQDEIDEVWKDRRNRLNIMHERMITDGELEGETIYLADYHPDTDGHVVLGYFPPENVRKVQKNSLGRDVLLEVDPEMPGGPPKRFYNLNSMHDDIHITRHGFGSYTIEDRSMGASPNTLSVHGLCFVKFNDRPQGATRGRPGLLQVLDYIDIHDELVWSSAEREKLLRMFILDITDNSIQTAAAGDQKLREMGLAEPPDGPKVLIHNERMKLNLMSPTGSARPVETMSETVLSQIYGAKGMPLKYSGRDTESSVGTASSQDQIPGKRLRRKQTQWIDWWKEVVAIMITLRRRAVGEESKSIEPDEIKFKHMEVGGKDKSRGAAMIKDLAVSLSQMVNDGLVKREAANEILEQAFEEAGFPVSENNRGLGDSMVDQLKELQAAGLTPKTNQPPDMTGPTKGGVNRPGNRGENGGDDPQGREPRSVRRGDR